jgi:NADP-dependent 3-hydroxy acid dehydrogenase YdfG
LVRALHGAGAHVVATARRAAPLAQVVGDLPDCIAVAGDITSGDDRAAIVAATIERFERINGLSTTPASAISARPSRRRQPTCGVGSR